MCKEIVLLVFLLHPHLSYQTHSQTELMLNEIPESYANLSTGNSLWTSLLQDCKRPTMSCIQERFYHYLDDTLRETANVDFGGFLKITKNSNDYKLEDSVTDVRHNTTKTEDRQFGSPIEEVTHSLHKRAMMFMMTHDLEMQLPDILFDNGATFKISPRSIEDSGTVVKLELLPNQTNGEGRIFFKKIKEFLGEKLLMALLAILLVIKLLSVKFLFFLPMVMGVAAAKKLILKILLFIFPVLSHIFKLCPYVPHGTKFHHHQHHISHVHHVPHGHHGHHHHHHEGIEVIAPHKDGPPSLHHYSDHKFKEHEPFYKPDEQQELQFYSDGPSFINDFITHRKADNQNKVSEEDNNVHPWSAGGQGYSQDRVRKPASSRRPLTATEIEAMVIKAEKEALIKSRLQREQIKVQAENLRLQAEIRKALKLQEKLKLQSTLITNHFKPPEAAVALTPPVYQQPLIPHAQLALTNKAQNVVQHTTQVVPVSSYDPFYSPILEKLDKILVELGFLEEPCRERLICSMYKNPPKFSPHSNLISAELSRDSSELKKPTSTNTAVIRFYKYVQAARDGQDQRDCIRLYPSCIVNTEI